MTLRTFSALFLGVCVATGLGVLATHRPEPVVATAPAPADDPVSYGRRLVTETYAEIGPEVADADRRLAGNNLACQNCHLDGGTRASGLPLIGVARTYPKYSTRSGRVISLLERIDECMTRSMNGRALPDGSREQKAFVAYLESLGPSTLPPSPALEPAAEPPSAARGQKVFLRVCATCHQADGLGLRRGAKGEARGYEFPPLWGADSFNDGAGMDRFDRAVGFVQSNMPRGTDPAHPQLNLQEAWDVVALLQSKPRPHYESR